jgi:hypothetical protein
VPLHPVLPFWAMVYGLWCYRVIKNPKIGETIARAALEGDAVKTGVHPYSKCPRSNAH